MTAHDQVRREQILSRHRRSGKVCGACGQSWPCAEIASVGEELTRFAGRIRIVRLVALTAAVVALVAAGEALVAWAWMQAAK